LDRISIKKKVIKAFYNKTTEGLIFKTFGSSMWPLIETDDELEVVYEKLENLKKGDIILINSNNKFIAHRIISLNPIITKGDNSKEADSFKINNDTYLGIVISIKKTRFNIKLRQNILKKYYYCFKIFGSNIKYLDFLRKQWIKRKKYETNT
jgi:hypothetical protein